LQQDTPLKKIKIKLLSFFEILKNKNYRKLLTVVYLIGLDA